VEIISRIDGVVCQPLKVINDDRGYFMEVVKQPLPNDFTVKQASITMAYPGVIKAFHHHSKQTDIWCALSGYARCVLYDLRNYSPTYKEFDTIYIGESEYKTLLIPPLVAHGYQVLGNKPFKLLYFMDQVYNPLCPDEGRIAFNSLGYDWEIKNR